MLKLQVVRIGPVNERDGVDFGKIILECRIVLHREHDENPITLPGWQNVFLNIPKLEADALTVGQIL